MDDIIVIILTLLLTIFTAINQSKKKKRESQGKESGTNQEPGFWKTIMEAEDEEDLPVPGTFHSEEGSERTTPAISGPRFGGESGEGTETRPSRTVFPGEYSSYQMFRPSRQAFGGEMAVFDYEEGTRDERIVENMPIAKTENQPELEEEGILSDFSFRRAVVYSEILNPKYF